jgi:hypothetical protein
VYLVLEALFLLSVTAAIAFWLRGEGCKRYGRKKQLVALTVAAILLYPCISLADDFLVQQQPLEMPDAAQSQSKCGAGNGPTAQHAPAAAVPASAPFAIVLDRGVKDHPLRGAERSAKDALAATTPGLRAPPER